MCFLQYDIYKCYFYPRSPCGERREIVSIERCSLKISIHALLAESDDTRRSIKMELNNFYPRSPCGERHECWTALNHLLRFLSTLSLRRATLIGLTYGGGRNISIHALLAESDDGSLIYNNRCQRFLSTLSLRRATIGQMAIHAIHKYFYPRSPCGERQKYRL